MNLLVDSHDVYAYTGAQDFDAARNPLIFIHGGGLDHTVWLLQSRYFAHHGHGVMAVDLPAHGRSGGAPLVSIEDMADWIVRLMDASGIETSAYEASSPSAFPCPCR